MRDPRIVGSFVAGLMVAALALGACTSSGGHTSASSSPSQAPRSSGTPVAPGSQAGSQSPSGPGAGSTDPRNPSAPANQGTVLSALPGSRKKSCAQVGSHSDLRSGGIGLGNFQVAKRSFASQAGHNEVPQLSMYIIPEHSAHLTSASVRIDPSGKGKASTVSTKDVESADPYQYFAVTLPIATAGTYRLSVTSGADHGCFVVGFTK